MQVRSVAPAGVWRTAFAAVALVLGLGRSVFAEEWLAVDLDGDGRTEQLAVVTRHGDPAIRLTLDGGRTIWLRAPKAVRQLVAVDFDHDGDIDLVATTDGAELLAWFNHGRGRFSARVIHPRSDGPLGPRGPSLHATTRPGEIDFGLGADGALPTAHLAPTSIARPLCRLYASPTDQTLTSVACGPRAPPRA